MSHWEITFADLIDEGPKRARTRQRSKARRIILLQIILAYAPILWIRC